MTKKYLLLFSLFCFLLPSLQANRPFPFLPTWKITPQVPLKNYLKSEASLRLHEYSREVFEQAVKAQKSLPRDRSMLIGNPITGVLDSTLPPEEVLPPLPEDFYFQEDAIDYYLLRMNRQYLKEVDFMKNTVLPQLDERWTSLREQVLRFKQPDDPIDFVVQQIPPQVDTFVISFFHTDVKNFTSSLNYLWQRLRAKQPDREMIILTEFLPRGYEWIVMHPFLAANGHYDSQRPVPEDLQRMFGSTWDEAYRQRIGIIGLENPATMEYDINLRTRTPNGKEERTTFWASLEGIEIRNNAWKRIREEILKKHPGALIIYCVGDSHASYNLRSSLTQGLDPQKTFLLALYPSFYRRPYYTDDNHVIYTEEFATDPLETLINNTTFFPQNLLYFPDKKDAWAAGFDARLRGNFPPNF